MSFIKIEYAIIGRRRLIDFRAALNTGFLIPLFPFRPRPLVLKPKAVEVMLHQDMSPI